VVKLSPPGPPVITSVVNGASFQPGIEAGSWVTIKGANLANTFPGRNWRDDEVVNGNLPTSLDGVSVTIDGKPAFVYYISPTQINVQAPSDGATGAVSVVVTNNGSASAPATAQLQAAAPASFCFRGRTMPSHRGFPTMRWWGRLRFPEPSRRRRATWSCCGARVSALRTRRRRRALR
jgi:hypothetical protein